MIKKGQKRSKKVKKDHFGKRKNTVRTMFVFAGSLLSLTVLASC